MNVTLNDQSIIIISIFLLINFIAFIIMLVDKVKSQDNHSRRISEGMMFFMATFFGGIGIYAGMFAFRHKTRKWYFLIGIPLLILQNCAFLYIFYLFLSKIYLISF